MNGQSFKMTNLQYIVDYDYERSECECDEEYCRCTTIEDAWVDNINIDEVIEELYRKYRTNDSRIDQYCFDRICHIYKIYDEDLYEIETCGGYYGEEIEGVYFEKEVDIYNDYHEILALDSILEKIKYCLMLEYGHFIDCVKRSTSASIIEVPTNIIKIPQKEYFDNVNKDIIEEYKHMELPIGVCIKNGDYYKLVDGYHRYAANKESDSVSVIVLE